MNLKYYKLESFSGQLRKISDYHYELITNSGLKFTMKGELDNYCNSLVKILGLPIWGIESRNELMIKSIELCSF